MGIFFFVSLRAKMCAMEKPHYLVIQMWQIKGLF